MTKFPNALRVAALAGGLALSPALACAQDAGDGIEVSDAADKAFACSALFTASGARMMEQPGEEAEKAAQKTLADQYAATTRAAGLKILEAEKFDTTQMAAFDAQYKASAEKQIAGNEEPDYTQEECMDLAQPKP